MAYWSNDTSTPEVYVRPFPDGGAGVWRVSGREGGELPFWRADGKELFYFSSSPRRLVAVTFDGAGATPKFGQPQPLVETPEADFRFMRTTGDGQRILMARAAEMGETPVTVVTNWLGLLQGK
jgi:hypothetical protein